MTIAILLMPILEAFSHPAFGGAEAVALLGEPVRKAERNWELAPRNREFSEVELVFEDLPAGKHLLTTIRIRLRNPPVVSLEEIRADFGPSCRWLPSTGPQRPRYLAFDHNSGALRETVMLLAEFPRDESKLVISSMLVRRYYP